MLYSAVVTLPWFLITVSCIAISFTSVVEVVGMITIIPMILGIIFLVYARLACLITLGAIFGAVVLAAIVIQIVAMCLANSEYGKNVSPAKRELNSWKLNIYLWNSIYSVYDKISAIGEQEKTNKKQSSNETVNIIQNQKNIDNKKDKNVNINEFKSKNQNLNSAGSENISTNKKDNNNIKKMNLNLKIQGDITQNNCGIKNLVIKNVISFNIPEQNKNDQGNKKK